MDKRRLSVIIELIAERFKARLQRKTGWGKNEVQVELQRAIASVLADIIDHPETLQGS